MEKYCPKCFKKYPLTVEVCPADGSFLVSPHEKDLTGEVLDNRYTVLERIGRGGMGVVYRAEQHLIKRIVALKVLRREVVQDETAVKRFLTEAQAIASLDSRHTVTLYDFGVTRDGLLYYTMELLKGHPLSWIIRKEAPLDVGRAARLVIQVCDSLKEAHDRGILHRDLKPDNLFVVERDDREMIKVVDFGIAKLVGDSSVESVTRTGMIVGTPQYLSPEQALGNPVVPASDLYSLAIVLYELLAGVPPFQDETPMKTLWCHVRDPLPPLSSKNPSVQVPRSIEAFLARALEKEPGRRFPTAVAFRDALRKALEDHDAAPETVSLPSLSTTDEGLRLKTQAWDGKAGGPTGKPGATPAKAGRNETAMLGGAALAGDERPAAVSPASPAGAPRVKAEQRRAVSPAPSAAPRVERAADKPVSSRANAEARPDAGKPVALPVGKEESRPAVGSTAREVPETPRPVAAEPPANDGASLAVLGPETWEILRGGRRRMVWWGGAGGFVILAVVLALWQPWTGAKSASESVASAEAAKPAATRAEGAAAATKVEQQKAETEEAAAATKAEKERRKAEEAVAAKKAEDDRKQAEAEAARQEEERRRADEAAAAQKAEEEKRKQEEAAAAKQAEEEKRKAEEAATAQKAAAEAAQRKEEKGKAEEAKKAEEKRKADEAAAARKAEEEKRKADLSRRSLEAKAEEARKAEEERRKQDSTLERGRQAMQRGEYEKAIALFNEAKQGGGGAAADGLIKECYDGIRKREVKALVGKGNRAAAEKRWADCVTHLEGAVKLGGGSSAVEKQLKQCREMMEF